MIPGTNAEIRETVLTDKTKEKEIKEITSNLDERFDLYKPSISWILETAELLQKYQLLTGTEYKIKYPEDTII